MKNTCFLFLLFIVACNSPDTALQNEILQLKERLTVAENALATAQTDETAFIHTVFFWMNEGVSPAQKEAFAKNGLGSLTEINSIYKVYFGPAAMTPREVVDNSYDLALVCHFKNTADHDAYQDDPIHLKFIEDYKDLWSKVVVYDNLLTE